MVRYHENESMKLANRQRYLFSLIGAPFLLGLVAPSYVDFETQLPDALTNFASRHLLIPATEKECYFRMGSSSINFWNFHQQKFSVTNVQSVRKTYQR